MEGHANYIALIRQMESAQCIQARLVPVVQLELSAELQVAVTAPVVMGPVIMGPPD